jgi:hypothetical protein
MGHTGDNSLNYTPYKLHYSSKPSTVPMKNTVFWVVTMYTVAEIYRFFEGIWRLHLQGQSVRPVEMKVEHSSKIPVNFYQTTWHHIPEDNILHSHCLRSHRSTVPFVMPIRLKLMLHGNKY